MLIHVVVVAAAAAAAQQAAPLDCFVARTYRQGAPNMCERAFYRFERSPTAEGCAALCVADSRCVMVAFEASSPSDPNCRLSATCKVPTATLPGFVGYFRNSTTGSCAPSPPGPPSPQGPTAPGNWTRVFLTEAAAAGAVCLDGSRG